MPVRIRTDYASDLCGKTKSFRRTFRSCGVFCQQIINTTYPGLPNIAGNIPTFAVDCDQRYCFNYPSLYLFILRLVFRTFFGFVLCIVSPTNGILQRFQLDQLDQIGPPVFHPCDANFSYFTIDPNMTCGMSHERLWYVVDDCGQTSSNRQQIVHISPDNCCNGKWGSDCSCSSPPKTFNTSSCSGGVWTVSSDLLINENEVLVLGTDDVNVEGALTLNNVMEFTYEAGALGGSCFRSGLKKRDASEEETRLTTSTSSGAASFGTITASSVVINGDVRIVLKSSPGDISLPMLTSRTSVERLFDNVRLDSGSLVTSCERYLSPYQLPDRAFTQLSLAMAPDVAFCPLPLNVALIVGVTIGCFLLVLLLILIFYCCMRGRQLALEEQLRSHTNDLRRNSFHQSMLDEEKRSLERHETIDGESVRGEPRGEGIDSSSVRMSSASKYTFGGARMIPVSLAGKLTHVKEKGNDERVAAVSPRVVIKTFQENEKKRKELNEQKIAQRTEELKQQNATLRGKTIEGMKTNEELALVAADPLMDDPGFAALYKEAIKRRNLRTLIRVIVVLCTLIGAGLACYAVVDFVQFNDQTSAQQLLDQTGNTSASYLKFIPPRKFNDISVRSECTASGQKDICYLEMLSKHSNVISQWDQYLLNHQPGTDLTILTATLISSLVLDFIALILLGVAIMLTIMETKGMVKKKCSRPKVIPSFSFFFFFVLFYSSRFSQDTCSMLWCSK